MKKVLLFTFALALLVSCGQSYEEKLRLSRAERARIAREDALAFKVGVLPTLDCLPVYLAQERQLFDTLGVSVHIKLRNAQLDLDTALAGSSIECAVTDRKRMENMEKHGTELEVLGATNAYWQLISNRTARLKEPRQLGDKMVAMTRYSATDYLTDQILKGVKTSAPVFKIQVNDVNVRLRMLETNSMDAMWLTEPQATSARLQKHQVMADSRQMKEQLGVVAVRSRALVDARRRRQLALFVKAYNMACDSLNDKGLMNYTAIIRKYCTADDRTIKSLPKLQYSKLTVPNGTRQQRTL